MSSVLRGLRSALPALRTSADDADRVAYARDLWPRHHMRVRAGRPAEHRPEAIAWPTSTPELAELVRWAREARIPLVPFGAGSGVCGGVLPQANALVVDLKRMARVRAIDRDTPLVDVEAGHMGVPLEQTLNRAGFTLGHFPSSILCSTAGGWVATRSAGQCSGAYGKIEDMVASLECVTGAGEIVELRRRTSGPDLVPLVVGSEGTLAIVTRARLRLHPAPTSRGFGAWSFPTTSHGLEAMRAIFQAGLRPAVARLYDPFDAMLAKRGAVKPADGSSRGHSPGRGGAALRAILKRPALLNDLLHSGPATRALGGAMLVVVFEGSGEAPRRGVEEVRGLVEADLRGSWEGPAPAERWLEHRYAVSYRQAPVFANGAFVDTMEVAASWSNLGALYDSVRRALGEHVFVMAHFSHAYPDGCCIYFSFAGSARGARGGRDPQWDDESEVIYDRAWRAALRAAVDAGGTLSHHHGVGRSKAPRLPDELGVGIDVVQALMRAFDPDQILNPGNLIGRGDASGVGPPSVPGSARTLKPASTTVEVDSKSLLARVGGATEIAELERQLHGKGLTLDVRFDEPGETLADWLSRGAPGARDRWLDPVDQLLAGLEARLVDGRVLRMRPAPRRAVGPDLSALFVGAGGRFGRIESVWLRVHPRGVERPVSSPFRLEREPPVSKGEGELLDAIAEAIAHGRG